mgnify:CR=1 FL=1
MVFSSIGLAAMKDRLVTPSKHYANIEKSLFLDIQLVGGRLFSVGAAGLIAFSDDNGSTWQQALVPVSSTLTALYFPSEDIGWAVGHGGIILVSKDRGETWQIQYDGYKVVDALYLEAKGKYSEIKGRYDLADEYEKEDLAYDLEDAEFAVSDAEYEKELGPANPFLDVWFKNDKEGYVIGAYGLFFTTIDSGENWKVASHRLENMDRYHLNAIQGIGGSTILIAGEAGTLFASYDDGLEWEALYAPYQGSYFGVQALFAEGDALVYGMKGNVYRSQDAGQSWDKVDLGIETAITSSTRDDKGSTFLVGYSGVVFESTDKGNSFSRLRQNNYRSYLGVGNSGGQDLMLISDQGIEFALK